MDARHGITHEFNHDATPVLLASMGAICRGLNITGANHIIIAAVDGTENHIVSWFRRTKSRGASLAHA